MTKRIEELVPGDYSCDITGMVVKKWREDMRAKPFTSTYIVDFTQHDLLRDLAEHWSPHGKYTLKIDAFRPHMDTIDSDVQVGQIALFKNVSVKLSKNGELEGTMFPNKNAFREQSNVSRLPEHDARYKDLQKRREAFLRPKPNSNGRKRRNKERAEAELKKAKLSSEDSGDARNPLQPLSAADAQRRERALPINDERVKIERTVPERADSVPQPIQDSPVRRQLRILREYISGVLASDAELDEDDLAAALSAAADKISGRTAEELNAPSNPNSTASLTLRPLKQDPLVYLEARQSNDPVQTALLAHSFGLIDTEQLEKPWNISRATKQWIKYPEGYEPFLSSTDVNPRVRVSGKRPRVALSSHNSSLHHDSDASSKQRFSFVGQVWDFYPAHIADFAQRTYVEEEGSGVKRHTGDRLEFWLYVGADHAPSSAASGAQERPELLKIWVPNASAEKLLGMTATQILEGREDGLHRLRLRLRELWGDLELVKEAFLMASGTAAGAENAAGWRNPSHIDVAAPIVELGLRRLRIAAADQSSASLEPAHIDVRPSDGATRFVLECTSVVLGDLD